MLNCKKIKLFILVLVASIGITFSSYAIDVVPYNPKWPIQYREESVPVKKALGSNCNEIYHFGSTAVPKLQAKPIIDILVVVEDLSKVNEEVLENLGYINRGEVVPTGILFAKDRVNLHIFEKGNSLIEQNLLVRDWLREHDDDRVAYGNLKMELGKVHKQVSNYCNEKSELIRSILERSGFDMSKLITIPSPKGQKIKQSNIPTICLRVIFNYFI